MMRSLSSAVAGLRTHQTKMDVIGNNIANVNTYGFKGSRTTFQDVYYQNLSSGSRANGAISGGTNPTQIGYGASVATIDVMITQSGSASTDRALDVYLSGDGFITSKDAAGNFVYTRLGNLRFDGDGNLVDGMGNFIQGFPMGDDGKPVISPDGTVDGSELVGIRCDPEVLDRLTGISISTTGAVIGILPGDSVMQPASGLPSFVDKGSLYIPTDSPLSGNVSMIVGALPTTEQMRTGLNGTANSVKNVQFGEIGLPTVITKTNGASISTVPAVYTISSTANGEVVIKETNTGTTYTGQIKDGKAELKSNAGKIAMTIEFNDNFVAQQIPNPSTGTPPTLGGMGALRFQVTTTDKGGNIVKLPTDALVSSGDPTTNAATGAQNLGLNGITVNVTGAMTATNRISLGTAATSEGDRIPIGNLVLAKFRNAAGLEETGSSYFRETFNSGAAIYVKPSLEGTGAMKSGYLEMSNVDLSKEFTDMITTQRGFQSNSRIVTVSDEMLQELVNLKR